MSINREFSRMLLRSVTANSITRVPLMHAAQAGLLPESIWKRLPVERPFVVNLPNQNTFCYSSILEDSIGRALFWRGWNGYESEVATIFYKLACVSNVVVDVGAHTGYYTLLACAANPRLKVVCFEPVPFLYQRLANHIHINKWEMRCDIRMEAVSSGAGVAQLHVPPGKQPVSSSLHADGFIVREGTQIEVSVTTIDTTAASIGPINLVKIDAEGYEDKVLEGMQKVIASSKPYIIAECMPDGPFKRVETLLRDYGYMVFHLHKAGVIPVQRITPDPNRKYPNYFCSPGELPREIL